MSTRTQSASPSASAATAQTVGVNFAGPTYNDSGFLPPDSMGAVGPTQILVTVNGRVRSFDRAGNQDHAIDETLDNFFGLGGTGAYSSDPRVRYDRFSRRWFVSAIDVPASGSDNDILVAVSNGSSLATGGWYIFAISADPGTFLDFDTLGIDHQALYLGANVFTGTSFTQTNAYVVDKASAISGAARYGAVRGLIDFGNGVGPLSPAGVDNLDSGSTAGFFIGDDGFHTGKLDLLRITNPLSATPTFDFFTVTTSPTAAPLAVPQPSPGASLDGTDTRLSNAVIRNGRLWTSQTTGLAPNGTAQGTVDRDGVRWYALNGLTTTPAIAQSGTIFDPAATTPFNYWIPSIMVSGQGHTAVGASRAGTDSTAGFASVAVAGRLATDAAGTMSAPVLAQASASTYHPTTDTVERWGDFSNTTVDPSDDMTMWTFQEYVSAQNVWGIRVVQLVAPAPTFAAASVPHTGLFTTPVTVTGTGFFDPGSGFAKRLTASGSGGLVVNHVTSVSPTQVVLDVSTVNAAPGAHSLTIKNPDGQTSSGTVTVGAALPCLTCSDFNADGKPDIFYWNKNTGATDIWFMNGSVEQSSSLVTPDSHGFPRPTWVPVATADFDVDGKPDILYWNSSTGATDIWFMNGKVERSSKLVTPDSHGYPRTTWVPVGTGDFDGDGKPDILYWNKTTGATDIWFMNGSVERSSSLVTPDSHGFPRTSWVPVAAGDFDGDGKPDILYWNNGTGVTDIWFMNGKVERSSALVVPDSHGFPRTSWLPVAAGDFDGDKKPDILYWNNGTGATDIWFMNGKVERSSKLVSPDSHGYPRTYWVPVA